AHAADDAADVRADRVGVLAQPVTGERVAQRGEDARRRRIWVLVGVELDELAVARLLTGGVAGHRTDGGTAGGVHDRLSFFVRCLWAVVGWCMRAGGTP